jgi:hypothetical protein
MAVFGFPTWFYTGPLYSMYVGLLLTGHLGCYEILTLVFLLFPGLASNTNILEPATENMP